MYFSPTDKNEITEIIKSLDNSTSPGLDGIPSFIVKAATKFIASPLSFLINSAITYGYFLNK